MNARLASRAPREPPRVERDVVSSAIELEAATRGAQGTAVHGHSKDADGSTFE